MPDFQFPLPSDSGAHGVSEGMGRWVGGAAFAPADLQTFAHDKDRDRLSPVALKAFRSLAKRWGLANPEAAALLGVSASTWDRVKRGGWDQALSQDQLTRVSALVGVFKGLGLLFADDMADRWPRLPNTGPLFARQTPIQAMIEGGIPRMLEVRRYVDAVRGGL
ncbi:MAG: antitoxin Xre-like helix-turn-helix domain-containing protein [Caulobacteraceae bacterium]